MGSSIAGAGEHADAGWDDYAERVLRNEARLEGLENLVAETRASDRKLIEQRSESLARELERRADSLLELVTARADAVLTLGKEEREADRREVGKYVELHQQNTDQLKESIRREGEITLKLLREVYDTALSEIRTSTKEGLEANLRQSQAAIHELELRRVAATEKVEQMVRQWRESVREARELFAAETTRHLEQLNHNNERISLFQANSVTRELWQSEKDASISREGVLRDQILALERTLLGMTPLSSSDKAHAELRQFIEKSVAAQGEVLSNKIGVVDEKVVDLKTYRDTTMGKSSGYTAFWGWIAAAITLILGVVVAANALFR